ncbi:MAG: low molecular weight phosphotyrosine protein phosphatase [Clostridiales bacterium]|nr:low molecular weight phosphotyrosine protein phosphatase [Clostridiales bacterium]
MIKVLFVCHGNVCRSTMAQSMFQDMVNKKGLSEKYFVDSAATSREEIGNGPHYGTVSKLRSVGIPVVPHRARQMTRADYEKYDYLIGMDSYNISNMMRIAGGDPDNKIFQLLKFAGSERSIADPWYTDNFDETYDDLKEGLNAFMKYLETVGK